METGVRMHFLCVLPAGRRKNFCSTIQKRKIFKWPWRGCEIRGGCVLPLIWPYLLISNVLALAFGKQKRSRCQLAGINAYINSYKILKISEWCQPNNSVVFRNFQHILTQFDKYILGSKALFLCQFKLSFFGFENIFFKAKRGLPLCHSVAGYNFILFATLLFSLAVGNGNLICS